MDQKNAAATERSTHRGLPYRTLIVCAACGGGGATAIVFSLKNSDFVLHNAVATSDGDKQCSRDVRPADFIPGYY